MNIQNHVLAVVQVFEDSIDIKTKDLFVSFLNGNKAR